MARARWKRQLVTAAKLAITLLVLWAVGRHVIRTWTDLRAHRVEFRIQPGGLFASGLLYLAGLSCCGWFYASVLRASPTPIETGPAMRAYLISHLGKYVPGKAVVVLMRAGMSVSSGARGATAAIATVYETLVMMAAGGMVAAAGFALAGESAPLSLKFPGETIVTQPIYRLAAIAGLGLGLAFLVVVLPPVFRRLALLVSLPIPGIGPDALPSFTPGLLARGLAWSALGWALMGWSQLELARSLDPIGKADYARLSPLVAGSVAIATVAGFLVAVLPGGLGVREGVLMYALGPALGEDLAVVAALALRLVWVASEILAAAILLPLGRRARTSAPETLAAETRSSPP